jgi:hypothetical protein
MRPGLVPVIVIRGRQALLSLIPVKPQLSSVLEYSLALRDA